MAIVYRTVPSLASTIERFNSLNSQQENLEGIMYDFGYISFEDVYPFYTQNEEITNTFKLANENYKFFFLFSYDALMCTFSSIDGYCYAKWNFELLEYNIPIEILLKYCGYGFYNGKSHVEFCIPESEFNKNSSKKLDIKLLENKLSKYKELENISDYEDKRLYLTDFITGKKLLYDCSELYNEHDILSFQKIIEQLNQKGIISPDNIHEIYEMFKIQSYDVYKNSEYEIRKLRKNLQLILK